MWECFGFNKKDGELDSPVCMKYQSTVSFFFFKLLYKLWLQTLFLPLYTRILGMIHNGILFFFLNFYRYHNIIIVNSFGHDNHVKYGYGVRYGRGSKVRDSVFKDKKLGMTVLKKCIGVTTVCIVPNEKSNNHC